MINEELLASQFISQDGGLLLSKHGGPRTTSCCSTLTYQPLNVDSVDSFFGFHDRRHLANRILLQYVDKSDCCYSNKDFLCHGSSRFIACETRSRNNGKQVRE